MTQQTILEEGAFNNTQRTQINDNFDELYSAYPTGVLPKTAAIELGADQLTGSEVETSFAFPSTGAIFQNAWIKVTDAESGTIDVGTTGTSNDPDGILDGTSVATLGYAGQVPAAKGALIGTYIPGDTVSVTSSGDLDSCEATLYIQYLELPAA